MNLTTKNNCSNQLTGDDLCIAGDTLVAVADGRYCVTIQELAEIKSSVPVYCLDEYDNLRIRMMRKPKKMGKKQPVYKVTFSGGGIIKTTKNLKFKLPGGKYTEVKDLLTDDKVKTLARYKLIDKDMVVNSDKQGIAYTLNSYNGKDFNHSKLIDEYIEAYVDEVVDVFYTKSTNETYIDDCIIKEIKLCGVEDVYSGIVDVYRNYFIGGFNSKEVDGYQQILFVNIKNYID